MFFLGFQPPEASQKAGEPGARSSQEARGASRQGPKAPKRLFEGQASCENLNIDMFILLSIYSKNIDLFIYLRAMCLKGASLEATGAR